MSLSISSYLSAVIRAVDENTDCPITGLPMVNPVVVTPCGHRFEEGAIKKWVNAGKTCPCCREGVTSLKPDVSFGKLIQMNCSAYPAKIDGVTWEEHVKKVNKEYPKQVSIISGAALNLVGAGAGSSEINHYLSDDSYDYNSEEYSPLAGPTSESSMYDDLFVSY